MGRRERTSKLFFKRPLRIYVIWRSWQFTRKVKYLRILLKISLNPRPSKLGKKTVIQELRFCLNRILRNLTNFFAQLCTVVLEEMGWFCARFRCVAAEENRRTWTREGKNILQVRLIFPFIWRRVYIQYIISAWFYHCTCHVTQWSHLLKTFISFSQRIYRKAACIDVYFNWALFL